MFVWANGVAVQMHVLSVKCALTVRNLFVRIRVVPEMQSAWAE